MANWLASKLNWLAGDAPTPVDFNRIEGNTQYLKEGLDKISLGVNAKPASDAPSTWPDGIYYTAVYNNGYPVAYGTLLTIKGATGVSATQLLQSWPGADGGNSLLFIRAKRDTGADAWGPWLKLTASVTGTVYVGSYSAATISHNLGVQYPAVVVYKDGHIANSIRISFLDSNSISLTDDDGVSGTYRYVITG